MLALTRKPGEEILLTIGDTEIVVTVEAVDGYQVRIGVDAPRSVNIVRTELLEAD